MARRQVIFTHRAGEIELALVSELLRARRDLEKRLDILLVTSVCMGMTRYESLFDRHAPMPEF